MRLRIGTSLALAAVVACAAETSTKPRVFIAGGEPETVSGEAVLDGNRSTLALTRTAPSWDIETMRAFSSHCSGVVVTTNREKADVIVRVERDDVNPTTPFVKANKVAVFDLKDELVYATRARLLSSAVKDACRVVLKQASR